MNTATFQDSLHQLVTELQPALQALFPDVPLQVRCARKQDQLLIMGQHPPGETIDIRQAIRILERTVFNLPASAIERIFAPDPLPTPCIVTVYLRALGQQRPYAAHRFEYHPLRVTPDAAALTPPDSVVQPPPPPPFAFPVDPPAIDEQSVAENQSKASEIETTEVETANVLHGWETAAPDPEQESAIELSNSFQALLEAPAPAQSLEPEKPARPAWIWPATLVGVSIFGLLGGMAWVFSRPCGVGACPPVEQAVQFNQQLPQTLQAVQTVADLQPLQQQVTSLTEQLHSVPGWSASHQSAQALVQQYQDYEATIQQIESAEAAAARAREKGEAPAQASTNWQSVKSLWQQAIAQLRAVPASSPFYELAQRRLMAFGQASRSVTQALTTEQQATRQLTIAQSTAKLAESRQSEAKSLENWQLAQATWQVAVNTLQKIPQTATSYTQAQSLLTTYQTKLADVRGRTAQEKLSRDSYAQAMTQAQQAKVLEGQNQWSAATAAWRSALNSAKQVPQSTFFYNEAQALVPTYEASLNLAESKLKAAVNLQDVQAELKKVCAGVPQTCTYTITQSLIKVQFTSAYERAARTAYIMGQGNAATMGGMMQHFDSLKAALQTITRNAGIPLEVYGADNTLLGSFNP